MSLFNTLEGENREVDEIYNEIEEFDQFYVNDLEDKEIFIGEIALSNIKENEFKDENTGEMVKKFSSNLYIINRENEEALIGRLNHKTKDDNVQFWKGSQGYDIIDSLEELNAPGTGGKFDIYKMSFDELQTHVNQLGTVTVQVIEHNGKFVYNTLRITKVN